MAELCRYELIDAPADELRQPVLSALQAFNRQANPQWYAARDLPENQVQALDLFAFDSIGQVVGGLFAETQLLWLKIHILAVLPDFRGQGIGGQLLRQAEAEGLRRGCQFAFVDTMEYQAPQFYERLGYYVVGRLDNWDSFGHAKLYLRKDLN